jgi:hypothetical protein
MIRAALSWYCAGSLHGRIIASDYVGILGQQVLPLVQVFPKNDVIFQCNFDVSPIHTARSVCSRFEVHEDVLN